MADYQLLSTEVNTDPLQRGYAGMTNLQVATDMNTPYRTRINPQIPLSTLAVWAASTGVRAKLQQAALNNSSPVQSIALALVDLFQGMVGPSLDLSNSSNAGMMTTLVSAGIMSSDQATILQALTVFPLTRAIEVWGYLVTEFDILAVRS